MMFDDKSMVVRARDAMRAAGFSAQEITRLVAFRRDLRDEIATAAMQALLTGEGGKVFACSPDGVSARAYAYADAMLKQREMQ